MELTILMPCLNEALTVETCIRKARAYLEKRSIAGEVLVADNGSTDGSQTLAAAAGARVIEVANKGYGAALMGGIEAASGRYVIMADADDSYDFTDLDGFVDGLRQGFKLVIGNRFQGGIKPGAMPLLNRYLGNPVLSLVGRTLFASPVGDFHCGLRGFERQAILGLRLRAPGMEFASEMVVKASLASMAIAEVPTTLSPDGRQRAPHLRPWRDGWRHLRFMLLRSPQWLFLYPGLLIAVLGLVTSTLLIAGPIRVPGVFTLDINGLLYCSIAAIVGVQITFFGLFAMAFARKMHLRIVHGFPQGLLEAASGEVAIAIGGFLILAGIGGALYAVLQWGHSSFGALIPSDMMRITIPTVATLAIGTQILFGGLLLGFIEIE
ncbi:MAG TPA: glycosyltransferase family 2 protein [Steroidobacteraceae bacterium]|jgi:glycosyltransferase involved in cell wall biosynthesis|nr:glycosyltransferase family 2 protein [Steroidobacteraceae bacterium]